MTLFINQSGKLIEIREKPFKLEKEIQTLFEANLSLVLGLELVKSEFKINDRRIDTLAFDKQNKAFIIIEYKRGRNISVVDQGFAYLSLMLVHKADFIIEYNESLKQNLRRDEVDWSQTRVVFVSTSFTDDQIQSTNFKDIAIELWEIKQFENNSIIISPIKKSNAAASIKPVMQKEESLKIVTDEIKVYTEEDNTINGSEEMVALYQKFKLAIFNLSDEIEMQPKKHYIAFKKGKNITDIGIQKNSLKIWINLKKGKLDDPKKISEDVSERGKHGNGDYQIQVINDRNLEYIMSLVKQAIVL